MLKVGLTGGIGSGKSTVAKTLQAKGITLIDADQIARDVVQPGELALQDIVNTFGSRMLLATGHLDRPALKQRIFSDSAAKKSLEKILHPRIRQRILTAVESATDTPYVVADIPLLVENNYQSHFDRVIVVDCPEAIQIARIQTRDEMNDAQIRQIIASQATRAQRQSVATDLIDNSGDLNALNRQIEKLHESLLSLI